MYFVLTTGHNTSNKISIHMEPDIPLTDLKRGDTIIFRGLDPFKNNIFYKIADQLTPAGIDYIVETDGFVFALKDRTDLLLKRYPFKEIIIKIFTLNFTENDRITGNAGNTVKAFWGIRNLKSRFQQVSLMTTINKINFVKKIKEFDEIKQQFRLESLYLVLEDNLTIEDRKYIIKEIVSNFKDCNNIIVRNNSFDIKITPSRREKIDISSDIKNGICNLVLKNSCTNNCTYCTTRIVSLAYNSPLPYDDKEGIIEIIRNKSQKLKTPETFEIVAVEPLEHPDIIDILQQSSKEGFKKIRLLTHGRPLKDIELINTLKRLKVNEIIIPISFYSPQSALINVREISAFEDMKEVLKNIKKTNTISFIFNIMISKQNYQEIQDIVKFLRSNNINTFMFHLALPSIEDKRYFIPYGVRFSDLLSEVNKIKNIQLKESIYTALSSSIPPCVLIRYSGLELINKIKSQYNKITEKSISSKRRFSRYKSTTRCPEASRCAFGSFCVGINLIYTETFGDEEFSPEI